MSTGRPIRHATIAAKREYFRGRRTFGLDDLQLLLDLIGEGQEALPVGAVVQRPPDRRDGLVALRHDVDHDLENAVRFAALERQHGLRSSYYVLHTDWYYRASKRGGLSPLLVD